MSLHLKEKIEELFQATKDLRSLEEIKPHCEQFNEWINLQTTYNASTLGTYLSRYGFYKKFRSLPLEQGKNADSIPKHDANGNVTGTELKHYVLLLCGLDKDKWKERNDTTRVIDRLGNDQEVDPDTYLELTGKLLESEDPHELAVGLIAATGRRPHEILVRGKFTAVAGEGYQVLFEGQGKKRGEEPAFNIATLYPADYIIKKLGQLRRDPVTKALLKEVVAEFPDDIAAQNRSIENKRGNSLRRVVQEYFGGKNTTEPLLNFRDGQEQNDCKALRAAYACLATKRDCDRSVGSQMLHYARLLGHFVKEKPTDKELQAISTTIGYGDYFSRKPVGFPPAPQKEKSPSIKVFESDFELIKQFQDDWQVQNQQLVVNRLIESHHQKLEVAKELLETKTQIVQLERQNNQLLAQINQLLDQNNQLKRENQKMESTAQEAPQQIQQISINATELEALLEQMVEQKLEQKLKQALANLPQLPQLQIQPQQQAEQQQPIPTPIKQPKPTAPTKEKEVIDWELKSNAELWATKAQGAAAEKIRRSYEAICFYNDTIATGDSDRLAITNLALRELSGVNGLTVGEWIKSHADEIISHHCKYGMQNSKDHSRVETYFNKRHGQEKIEKILQQIRDTFLNTAA